MSNIIYPEIVETSIANSAVKNGDQNPKLLKQKSKRQQNLLISFLQFLLQQRICNK